MKLLLPAFFVFFLVGCGSGSGKPNILIFLADDMGFSDPGCYGGEIHTPNLDRLAAGGLRFTRFYNTGRCWPTRSALLSGYYPQQIRMDPPKGRLPQWARLLPHDLKPAGYRCYHSGKWHIMGLPKAVADGGFDHSYIVHDHDRYFYPQKHEEDDQPLPPVEKGTPFYNTDAIADHAIKCLKEHAEKHSDQPFFQYVAFLSPHFPLHAPAEDIARYKNEYLRGWDQVRQDRWARLRDMGMVNHPLPPLEPGLSPRYLKPEFLTQLGAGEVPNAVTWNTLTPEQKEFQAAKMAVHAAMVDHMDRQIGRVLEQVRAMGAEKDTIVFFLSDNGADATLLIRGDGHDPAAAPGSGGSYLCMGPGWASASNTPFHRHKIWVHEGGVSTPLIVNWPRGLKARGELRHNLGHVTDLVPTILQLAGVQRTPTWNGAEPPAMPGHSLVPALTRDGSVNHEFIFFNHEGNRALRMGDWKLVSSREDKDAWELYNLATDRGETDNLAAKEPERVSRMEMKWNELEAEYRRWGATP